MELGTRSEALLRRVIYPVQFDADPVDGIDRVIRQVVKESPADISQQDYIRAIDDGLASTHRLSELIPQSHSEAVIRVYLSALRKRME